MEELFGDVGCGDGADAADGNEETAVAADALDASFGAAEWSVDDADVLAFFVVYVGIGKVVKACLARRGDKAEYLHLAFGNGIRPAALRRSVGSVGVDNGTLCEHGLHTEGLLLRRVEKHQRTDDGSAHTAALAVALNDDGLGGHVSLDACVGEFLRYSKNFVVEHLQCIPMLFDFCHRESI